MIDLKKRLKILAAGSLSHTPLRFLVCPRKYGTGGTDNSRYCYSVWLRHLVRMSEQGLPPRTARVAELGPGDSIGVGLAALLSGSEAYLAFDVVPFSDTARNLRILEGVLELMRARAPIPDAEEFPLVRPLLRDYRFPHQLLPEERLAAALHPDRLERVRHAVRQLDGMVRYHPRWELDDQVEPGSLDLVFSQAVLEHVQNAPGVYAHMFTWLKSGGVMSHQIDFSSHNASELWNGHWTYSPLFWNFAGRCFPLNRLPCSAHLELLEKTGFEVLEVDKARQENSLQPNDLAAAFRTLSRDDLETSAAYVLARKP